MNENWIGLIPAAGKGLRLGLPYPKELYPIIQDNRYKPVSQFIVDQLVEAGVHHIVFIINESKHQLMGYFRSEAQYNCTFSYVYQDPWASMSSTSPGLAQAIDSSYHLIKGRTVFFGMPDTIISPSNVFAISYPRIKDDFDFALCLFQTTTPEKFGMVELDENDRVTRIFDKPNQTLLKYMWGAILWNGKFTEFIHEMIHLNGMSDFAEIMNRAIKEGLNGQGIIIKDGTFNDLGTYDEIMKLDAQFRAENLEKKD